jgi:two-component system, chemotaxis family, sensor kinase CheA
VEDDGVGLNLAAVRERAVSQGLLGRDEAATASPQEIAKLIFRPGFSTSAAVTNISGRGLGLSVVQETVDRLQGEIEVNTSEHSGLRIAISVALSISTQQLLLVETAGFVFGLPARAVRQLLRVRLSGLRTMEGRDVLMADGKALPLSRLSDMLGLAPKSQQNDEEESRDPWISIVTMAWGEKTAGVIVDRLLDEREAVVKELGLPRHMTGLTTGGILLEDGRVALSLNPAALFDGLQGTARMTPLRKAEQPEEKSAPRILVVDDSLTTRSLEKSILEAHGFQVSVAVDGVEALEKLGAAKFDLVITDVIMPRMDGMQLLERMKAQRSTGHIPVIMVTSIEKKEDQQRGMSLGADAYIVKRKFDQEELLRTVRQIL